MNASTSDHPLGPLISEHRYSLFSKVKDLLLSAALVAAPAYAISHWLSGSNGKSPAVWVMCLIPCPFAFFGVRGLVKGLREWNKTWELRERGIAIVQPGSSRSYPWKDMTVSRTHFVRSGGMHVNLRFADGSSDHFTDTIGDYDALNKALLPRA